MTLVFLGLIAYFFIGMICFTLFGENDADVSMVFFWPVLLIFIPIFIVTGLSKGLTFLNKKIHKGVKKLRKTPPSPTEIMNGVVAAVVVENFKQWEKEISRRYGGPGTVVWKFSHKNIKIYGDEVTIGGDVLVKNEELTEAISKSKKLYEEWKANEEKYQKELRMLSHLEEFMGVKGERLINFPGESR